MEVVEPRRGASSPTTHTPVAATNDARRQPEALRRPVSERVTIFVPGPSSLSGLDGLLLEALAIVTERPVDSVMRRA
jgi:hypothetical protein